VNITVPIPDDLAHRLGTADALARRALEAFALEEYRAERLTKPELRRLLAFETRFELDGFLKAHGVYESFTLEEIEDQVKAMERLGF
jgi:hypothetical protein